ncbi:Anaphase-promoting complex subunit 1 [Rhodotorula kratochvilovae]
MAALAPLRDLPPPAHSQGPVPPAQPVPPSLLPAPTSRFQLALQAASRRVPAASTAPCSCFVPAELSNDFKNGAAHPDNLEELSWSGRRVVWSRGGSLFRQFTFDEHDQDVAQALFVDFEVPSPADPPSQHASTSAYRLDSPSLFGPYRRPTSSSWSDDPLPLPRDPPSTTSSPETPAQTQRTLLILLSSLAFAYPPTGGCVPLPLPFRVARAWALASGGVLLERASGEGAAWYTLSGPLDELRPAAVRALGANGSGELQLQDDADERVVFASSSAGNAPRVLVSANARTRKLRVWRYARLEAGLAGAEPDDGSGEEGESVLAGLAGDVKGKGKARAGDADGDASRASSAAMRTSLSGTKRKHGASFGAAGVEVTLAGGERSVRRASAGGLHGHGHGHGPKPRLSAGGAAGASRILDRQEHDLLEALGADAHGSRRPAMGLADRRASASRNDLSITMDRMALSQGASSVGMAALDMDREGTLLVGGGEMDESAARSEVVLEEVWDADLHNLATTGMTAYLFDVRSPASSTLAIHLPSAQVLLLLSLTTSSSGALTAAPLSELQAISATPVLATRRNVLDLLYLRADRSLALVSADGKEAEVPLPPLPHGRAIASLDGNSSTSVILTLDNGSRCLTHFEPPGPGLVSRCLEALAAVLPLDDFAQLQSAVHQRERVGRTRSHALQDVLDELFAVQPRASPPSPYEEVLRLARAARAPFGALRSSVRAVAPALVPQPATTTLTPQQQAILFALHLVAQHARLESASEREVLVLGRLVARLAAAKGLAGWVDYWRRLLGPALDEVVCGPEASPGYLPASPPDFLSHLAILLAGKTPSTAPFDLSAFASLLDLVPSGYYGSSSTPLALTSQLLALYTHLTSPSASSTTSRAHRTVLAMHAYGWTARKLASMSFAPALPLREAVRMCQLEAPEGWPAGAYTLIGRPDLARQVEGGEARCETADAAPVRSIDELAAQVLGGAGAEKEKKQERSLAPVPTAARFNEDKRLEEVARMLQFEQPAVISAGDRTLDQLTPQIQQSVLLALSARTLSLPVGQSMFLYRTKDTLPPDSIAIPRINTSARIIPMPSPVALIEKEPRDPTTTAIPDRLEWPDFHAGVAAALQLRAEPHDDGRGVDSSQISFNRPTGDLDARHAGLLMGLGLTGQLGAMHSSQAYEYLKAKHDPTSVGVLLGLAVSFLGTSDPTVTSVVSIHLPALHPPRSSSLNVSGMTQSAAAVALGLLHFGTGRRSYADVLLREMCGVKVANVEDGSLCREAYALSCGFAFGMIMLGQGREKSATAKEVDHLRTFRALILGEGNHALPGLYAPNSTPDVNVTSPAATIALALTYLRSERQDVAEILEIPDSLRNLDYVRADLLLLRTLARNLIVWSRVDKSKEWVEAQVPPFLVAALGTGKNVDPDLDVARWSIIAGACFAIGFKFAGTAAAEAHATLIHYLDRLTRASFLKSASVQGKIKRHALRSSLGVVAVALAMVMAGTGEINVLRRLRVAHGMFSEGVTYGSHLATHMALGLLFLGQGKHTLGSSDAAIAALLLALYPAFPATPTENRAHLQAYRHLWVLAVEPRYLEARDVDTGEPVFLPVRLRLTAAPDDSAPASSSAKTDVRAKQLVAPTLLPNLALIETIQIDSPRYWSFSLRLSSNPTHLARFLRDGVLHVKRRTGHLSYAQDPRGIRSIFTRSKSETGSAVLDFGETARMLVPSSSGASSGLSDFVRAFSGDAEALAITQALCRPAGEAGPPSAYEAFAASVLLECLTRDKRDIAVVYHAMHDAWRAVAAGEAAALPLVKGEELRFVVDFYRRGAFKSLFSKPAPPSSASSSKAGTGAVSRDPLLHASFIDHVASLLSAHGVAALDAPETQGALRAYLESLVWPSSGTGNDALARAVAHIRLPSLPALGALRPLVSAQSDGAAEAALALRRTRRGVEERRGRGGAWEDEASAWMVRAWVGE